MIIIMMMILMCVSVCVHVALPPADHVHLHLLPVQVAGEAKRLILLFLRLHIQRPDHCTRVLIQRLELQSQVGVGVCVWVFVRACVRA